MDVISSRPVAGRRGGARSLANRTPRWFYRRRGSLVNLLRQTLAVAVVAGTPLASHGAPPIIEHLIRPLQRHGKEPVTHQDPAVEQLAANIDWLEHQIDRWGTIVAKAPDVWGEARLTKHRSEVEAQLSKRVDGFQERISGAASVRDLALLAAAVSFEGTGNTAQSTLLGSNTSLLAPVNLANETNFEENDAIASFGLAGADALFGAEKLQLEQTLVLDQQKRYLDHLNELRRINEGDDAADAPGYSLNLVRIPVSVLPGNRSQRGHGAEITMTATMQLPEDLLPRTFRDLVINDLVDQLAPPMTRFLNSHPQAVRALLNGFEIRENPGPAKEKLEAYILNDPVVTTNTEFCTRLSERLVHDKIPPGNLLFFSLNTTSLTLQVPDASEFTLKKFADEARTIRYYVQILDRIIQDELGRITTDNPTLQATRQEGGRPEISQNDAKQALSRLHEKLDAFASPTSASVQSQASEESDEEAGTGYTKAVELRSESANSAAKFDEILTRFNSIVAFAEGLTPNFEELAKTVHLPSSLTRRSKMPFPPSQVFDVYGETELARLAVATSKAFRNDVLNRQVVHLTDVQAVLREEINGAYDMLASEGMRHHWELAAADQASIVAMVREQRHAELIEARHRFISGLALDIQARPPATLAWAVYVESILLSDRLNEEIRGYNASVYCGPGMSLPFFGPDPPLEAREAFAAYTAARWPLRIFTIDPVVTEQNIADTASIYRQMQFAAAFAVASGEMSANAGLRFIRSLQRDFATIDVNRTAVGFVHGEDTFGWRFYPRFQTPPVQSNLATMRDLIVGGPTDRALLKQRQIEPGMRECIAVILLPSFVSGVTIDTRSNWFCMTHPSHSALSMQELTQQSRAITQMRSNADLCVRRPDLYRDGEVDRMLRRVSQLDRELPLQTLHCRIPESNTLGGFEMLSSGTRELAPELHGWYGSPGYEVGKDKQVFFLIGDNFSVHETEVIVGARKPADVQLLSRQIMQVTLNGDLPVIEDERLPLMVDQNVFGNTGGDEAREQTYLNDFRGYVDVHVASPYGVSGHLLIPVVNKEAPKPPVVLSRPILSQPAQPIRVSVPINFTKDAYALSGDLIINQMPMAEVTVPPGVGLDGSAATITLQPTHANYRLQEIVLASIPRTGASYAVSTPQVITAVQPKGALHNSIGAYTQWLLNMLHANNPESAKQMIASGFELQVGATIRVGDGPAVAAEGSVPIAVSVRESL